MVEISNDNVSLSDTEREADLSDATLSKADVRGAMMSEAKLLRVSMEENNTGQVTQSYLSVVRAVVHREITTD
ncbi:MAG: Pentapeptide repeats (8 copies) [Haloquadratum sp. J07HQX50]|jgi:Pentapeptide repeats (8 copies).|nr:MAG: Pentapeptide repeats (8 copies) [Haloquadratum sp. J07HQX50]